MIKEKYVPDIYVKSVLDVDYKKLKEKGIKCLIFDLDNTLVGVKEEKLSKNIEKLLIKLSKDFKIIVVSNNFKSRVSKFCKDLNINFISFAIKPLTFKVKKVIKQNNLKENCIIGDQLISDVLLGKKMNIFTILVDPINLVDYKITKINRLLESKILRKLKEENLLERGSYYE